jgi:hypothetical protein
MATLRSRPKRARLASAEREGLGLDALSPLPCRDARRITGLFRGIGQVSA